MEDHIPSFRLALRPALPSALEVQRRGASGRTGADGEFLKTLRESVAI
jgi:hypothetical protein